MSIVPLDDRRPIVRRGPGDVIDLVDDYWRLAERISATEFVPKALRNRPEAVLAALLSGAERGLGPMESLRSMHVIEGVPNLSAEAMRALVLAAGHEIEIVETTAQRAVVMGRRAGAERWSPQFIWTLDRARRARLANKDNWQRHPEDMLLARASGQLCKQIFPDVIRGLAVREELEDEFEQPAPTVRRAPPSRRRQLAPAAAPPSTSSTSVAAGATSGSARRDEAPDTGTADLGGIPGADQPSWATTATPEPAQPADADLARRIHAEINQAFPAADGPSRDRYRHALVAVVTRRRDDGPVTSFRELMLEEQLKLSEILAHIHAGRATVTDEPDDLVKLRLPGGWWYLVGHDGSVEGGRGDQTAESNNGGGDSPADVATAGAGDGRVEPAPTTGEPDDGPPAPGSPDHLDLDQETP